MAWSTKKRLIVSCSVGWSLAVLGVVMIPLLEYVVKKKVEATVVIKEGGELYDIWKDLPIPIYMQIYMFNVTNPSEFLKGQKPNVAQSGPYTYRETRKKTDIVFNNNGTVSYRQKRYFHFVRDMSVGDESDVFYTPNPLYWGLMDALKYEPARLRKLIDDAAGLFDEKMFMTRSVNEIIWGYRDPLLNITRSIDPKWFYDDFVGYFMHKNATDDGVYTVHTGSVDIHKLGFIDKYNGSDHVNFWTTPWANMVNGTDGTLGPPYIPKDQMVWTFASDICRSIPGVFDKEVENSQGIKLWRYKSAPGALDSADVNPDNIGFCTPQTNCLGAGVINVSTCQTVDYFHLPAAFSFPHFYLADPKYINSVRGLHPNREEHQVIIEAEPYTGLVLKAAKRLMISLYLAPVNNLTETMNIKPVFMPIFWLNESAVVDDHNADKLKRLLFTPLTIIKVAEVVLISLGVVVVLASLIYGLVVKQRLEKLDKQFVKCRRKPSDSCSSDGEETKPLTSHQEPRGRSYTDDQQTLN